MLMKDKEVRDGWQWASADSLTAMLLDHLEMGDPIDVANVCMMLHQNGQKISLDAVSKWRYSGEKQD